MTSSTNRKEKKKEKWQNIHAPKAFAGNVHYANQQSSYSWTKTFSFLPFFFFFFCSIFHNESFGICAKEEEKVFICACLSCALLFFPGQIWPSRTCTQHFSSSNNCYHRGHFYIKAYTYVCLHCIYITFINIIVGRYLYLRWWPRQVTWGDIKYFQSWNCFAVGAGNCEHQFTWERNCSFCSLRYKKKVLLFIIQN